MSTMKIYRKESSASRPKVTKGELDQIERKLTLLTRVRRPELESFFIPKNGTAVSPFYKLPAIPSAVIDNPGLRQLDHAGDGWVIPVGSWGRSDTADRSTAQSIVLWIKKNLADVVNVQDFSIVVEGEES